MSLLKHLAYSPERNYTECDFSLPINIATEGAQYAFSHLSCSATNGAFPVEIASASAVALFHIVYIVWYGMVIGALGLGLLGALEFLRRR